MNIHHQVAKEKG